MRERRPPEFEETQPRRHRGRLAVGLVTVAATLGILSAIPILNRDDTELKPIPPQVQPSPLVNPDDINYGGVPPEGIPSIDEPRFQPAARAGWLSDREPVISLEVAGDARAYPLTILTWHEIVNDDVGGVPVAVTYCPLCNTPVVWERPLVDGKVTTFGTSGRLYRANLVMHDRATRSYWPQLMGQAVAGTLSGKRLELVPAQLVSFGDFRRAYKGGRVLTRNTGYERPYGINPYPGQDRADHPYLFDGELDPRLPAMERILGVAADGQSLAFPYRELRALRGGGLVAVNVEVGREPVLVIWKPGTLSALDQRKIRASRAVGAAVGFSRRLGERLLTFRVRDDRIVDRQTGTTWDVFGRAVAGPLVGERLPGIHALDSFWFDWAAFHPDTELWSPA
jgi:hypothetical protein